MKGLRLGLTVAVLALLSLVPSTVGAGAPPSGERAHGNVVIEPAYDDLDGSIIYLQTPNQHAPLNPNNPTQNVNYHAVAPLYLIAYPPGTPGVFNCMGDPGNCPDHDGAIAGLATGMEGSVYGSDPALVPGHDHLVGNHRTGDFNVAWRVYVELFTSPGAVTHITTLTQLDAAKAKGGLKEVDTGIVFLCSIVSASSYAAGTPLG